MAKAFGGLGVTVGLAADRTSMTGMVAGQEFFETDTLRRHFYNGSVWVCLTPVGANAGTSFESTTSTSFTDIATAGPSVTINTGTSALVTITAEIYSPGGQAAYASVAVSGATTLAASNTNRIRASEQSSLAIIVGSSRSFVLTGLTAGSNVFTMKYAVSAGTGNFNYRSIVVTGI